MFGIKEKLARSAKRAGLMSGGLLCCMVGTGFMTVSAWFGLVPQLGVPTTAAIIAGVYIGVGLILIGLSSREDHPAVSAAATEPTPSQAPPLTQAFLYGLQAGNQASKSRR